MGDPYGVLVADPPWAFRDHLPGKGRGAAKHYQCLPSTELERFPIPAMAPGAWCFLWRVSSMQQEALAVMAAWGFRLVSEVVWVKTKRDRSGPAMGMGHYVRNAHEICLIGVRDGASSRRLSKSVPSVIEAPRGRHSQKPEAFFELVEALAPGPYCELFARRHRPGWDCFGDQLPAVAAE